MQLLTRMYSHSQVTTQSTLGSVVLEKSGQKELHSAPFLGHSILSFSSQALSGQSFHDFLTATCQHASLCLSDCFEGHKHSHKSFLVPPRGAVMSCVCSYTLYPRVGHEHIKEVAFETETILYIDKATVCEQRPTELSLDFS